MKISTAMSKAGSREPKSESAFCPRHSSAFTMIEVAISLAIIGIALVAIVGVLPIGMNTQRDNRESTIVNQDSTVFIEAISKGARGADDLANYVYEISDARMKYDNTGQPQPPADLYIYTLTNSTLNGTLTAIQMPITNGLHIVGLLSTPEFTDASFNPTNNLFSGGYSNHVIAYVRSLSGPAVEKPPQGNSILTGDSFSYLIYCVNAPVATDTNTASLNSPYVRQLAANLHELRLTFLWPVLPNGNLPPQPPHQTYRALVAGQILQTNSTGQMLYFYQPQSFTSAP